MGAENPYRELVGRLSADEFSQLRDAVNERSCRDELGVGTLAEAAVAFRPAPGCPRCEEASPWRDGATAAGVPRWRCPRCSARFNSLSGTVPEHCRKPFPT